MQHHVHSLLPLSRKRFVYRSLLTEASDEKNLLVPRLSRSIHYKFPPTICFCFLLGPRKTMLRAIILFRRPQQRGPHLTLVVASRQVTDNNHLHQVQ